MAVRFRWEGVEVSGDKFVEEVQHVIDQLKRRNVSLRVQLEDSRRTVGHLTKSKLASGKRIAELEQANRRMCRLYDLPVT